MVRKERGISTSAVLIGVLILGATIGGITYSVTRPSKEENVAKPAKFEEFVISNLEISPKEAKPRGAVIVSINVKNVGDVGGTHTVKLKVDGTIEETKDVRLGPGDETTLSFNLSKEASKIYKIRIGNLSGSFEVLKPAEFKVTNLILGKTEVNPGEPVEILAYISNAGDLSGHFEAKLRINGKVEDVKRIFLESGGEGKISFTTRKYALGMYFVKVGQMTSNFRVLRPAIKDLVIRIIDLRKPRPGLTTVTFKFVLEFFNPAPRKISSPSGFYNLYINKVYVGSGSIAAPSIPPGERRIYMTKTVIGYANIASSLVKAIKGGHFTLKIETHIGSQGYSKKFVSLFEFPRSQG